MTKQVIKGKTPLGKQKKYVLWNKYDGTQRFVFAIEKTLYDNTCSSIRRLKKFKGWNYYIIDKEQSTNNFLYLT